MLQIILKNYYLGLRNSYANQSNFKEDFFSLSKTNFCGAFETIVLIIIFNIFCCFMYFKNY